LDGKIFSNTCLYCKCSLHKMAWPDDKTFELQPLDAQMLKSSTRSSHLDSVVLMTLCDTGISPLRIHTEVGQLIVDTARQTPIDVCISHEVRCTAGVTATSDDGTGVVLPRSPSRSILKAWSIRVAERPGESPSRAGHLWDTCCCNSEYKK
jgi:hypothetical protein